MNHAEAWKSLSEGKIVTHPMIGYSPVKQNGEYVRYGKDYVFLQLKFLFFQEKQEVKFDTAWEIVEDGNGQLE